MKAYDQLIRHEGNEDLFRAVEMSIAALVSDYPFHIHVEGLRGTGKTTILRAAGSILPPITRIKSCPYNCDPLSPHCPIHRAMSSEEIKEIGTEVIPRPFLEISHSAKMGTVVGSIDLQKLTDSTRSEAALLPGTIPRAHRGIVFIDEINRLADVSPEIADILLDVMGTKPGRIQVEETGLHTAAMPVSVTIWAASNPDEEPGSLTQIRRQLADRFDFAVNMGRPADSQAIFAILAKAAGLVPTIPVHVGNMRSVTVDSDFRNLLASIYVDFGLESLRSVEAMEAGMVLSAVLAGRSAIDVADMTRIVPLALGHRTDAATIANIIKSIQNTDNSAPQVKETVENRPGVRTRMNTEVSTQLKQNWWHSLVEKLQRKLASSRPNRQTSKDSSSQSCSAGGNGCAAASVPDTVAAPPNKAVPLCQLKTEQYVSSDDNKIQR
ncbi:Magnesium chelatase [Acetonema longum DSM 6540]|uniref:Mg-protoporphyrin IX chelatase n=2 Tax=Acetonema TaxID=2373 RepID=F7NND8_9FIRM|nr:Magnesium chelatase [Acetonema longum DSM 6540]